MLTLNLKKDIQLVLDCLNFQGDDFGVWLSKIPNNGHCFSNVVLVLVAKKHSLNQKEIADQIIHLMLKQFPRIIKIVFNSGFLNFFFSFSFFNQILDQIGTLKADFGRLNTGKNQHINYEWVSANPTGYLHLGHARNVFVGQAITNILEFTGFQITREFYINDYGNQVLQLGKTVFYHYQKLLGLNPKIFAQMYQNPEVITVAKKIVTDYKDQYLAQNFDKNKSTQKFFINFSKDFFLSQMKVDLASFAIKFDVWFSEASFYKNNYFVQFLKKLKSKKLTYLQDGALWFKATSYGFSQDFVLLKSDQLPTYFAGDIMYHDHKFNLGYQKLIAVFGADHHSHYLKIKSALKGLGHNANQFQVDLLQMVKIVQNGQNLKISKRSGNTFYLTDLVKMIGLDFLRFMLMSRQRETNFVFDIDLIKQKGVQNPLFYIQYAHTRSCQVLSKIDFQFHQLKNGYEDLNSVFEQSLILELHRFTTVLQRAALKREPQFLVVYALEISKKFHVFYEEQPILTAPNFLKQQRINLVFAFQQVLHNTLNLLGISAPSKM